MVSKKLGQPVPLSYFADDSKSGRWQAAQMNVPSRFSWLSSLEPGGSVLSRKRTAYDSGVSNSRHSPAGLSSLSTSSFMSHPFASTIRRHR